MSSLPLVSQIFSHKFMQILILNKIYVPNIKQTIIIFIYDQNMNIK